MKKILFLILSITLFFNANSQTCSDLVFLKIDKMTGDRIAGVKDMMLISDDKGKTGIGFFPSKMNESIMFIFFTYGASSCIDEDNNIHILFRDGTRLKMKNQGKYNCENTFQLIFLGDFGNEEQFQMFKTKEIEAIRIWTEDSFVERDFTIKQSEIFIKTVNCLLKI